MLLKQLPSHFGLYMPAEWATHKATWMSWPFDEEMWFDRLKEVRHEYADLVKTLARFEPIHLIVRDEEAELSAQVALQNVKNLTFHRIALDDVWLRDNGPIFLLKEPRGPASAPDLSLVNWGFNAWGEKYTWQRDNAVPLAIGKILQVPYFEAPLIMEGGSLDSNGQGICLTTEQCLLNPSRNPNLSKADLEKALLDYLGQRQVIWLGSGLEGDHTDGHVDTITRFVGTDKILSSVCSDTQDNNWGVMQENLDILRRTQLSNNQTLQVIELPLPDKKLFLPDGTRLPATYANFYIANGVVVMPLYGDQNDPVALQILQQVFPRHEVIGLSSRFIIQGGGSFHCMTQQQPNS